jgi:hypothetical protein
MKNKEKEMNRRMKMASVLTILGLSASFSMGALMDNFVGYYNFNGNGDDTSGSANVNNATLQGTSVNYAGTARFGSGSLHVENGDYASLGNPADYHFGANSFTISYWLNLPENMSGDPTLVGNKNWSSSGGADGFAQAIAGDDVKANAASGGTRKDTGWVDLDHDAYFNDGQSHWTFVALVVDRGGNTMYNYIADDWVTASSTTWASGTTGQDFGEDSSDPSTVDISDLGSLDAPAGFNLNIGQDGDGTGYTSLTGNIDDMGIWTRALSREELWEVYAEGRINDTPLGAIPEPATLSLIGLAGLAVFFINRRPHM